MSLWVSTNISRFLGRPMLAALLWHAIVIGTIVLIPAWIVFRDLPWNTPGANLQIIVGYTATYIGAVVAAVLGWRFYRFPKNLTTVAVFGGATSLLFLGLLFAPGVNYSRLLLLSGAVFLATGLSIPPLLGRSPRRLPQRITVLGTSAALVVGGASFLQSVPRGEPNQRTVVLPASRHILSATYYSNYLPEPSAPIASGGAIIPDPSGPGYLLATPRGQLYSLAWDENAELQIHDLRLRVPINDSEFESSVGARAATNSFRVADVVARQRDNETTLYASHHYWKTAQDCFVVRVSALALLTPIRTVEPSQSRWSTIFESSPCLPIQASRGAAFAGEQIGGNLEFLDDRRLLLTLGDHQFDGWYRELNLVRDAAADYGKTLIVDTETGAVSTFTVGHRNPQGLVVDSEQRIWSTEHGPQGGDELNLLRPNADYGYPDHSYGTEYGSVTWPPSENVPADVQFTSPIFAWIPSIGISDLISARATRFVRWEDDLLIASLTRRAVWRVRIEGQRVIYAEPIEIGERIRDIAAGELGDIVLWTDNRTIVRLEPIETLNEGAGHFTMLCGGCHDNTEHRIGPNLQRVFERPIASAPGFAFSRSLSEKRGDWTEARLHEFLTDPRAFAPGTTMVMPGIANSETRSQIIEYLRYYY